MKRQTKRVAKYDTNGNKVAEYDSVISAANTYANPESAETLISTVARNRRGTAYGYVWRYVTGETKSCEKLLTKSKQSEIKRVYNGDTLPAEVMNAIIVCKQNGLSIDTVYAVLFLLGYEVE